KPEIFAPEFREQELRGFQARRIEELKVVEANQVHAAAEGEPDCLHFGFEEAELVEGGDGGLAELGDDARELLADPIAERLRDPLQHPPEHPRVRGVRHSEVPEPALERREASLARREVEHQARLPDAGVADEENGLTALPSSLQERPWSSAPRERRTKRE